MAKGSTQSVVVCTPSTTASTAQQAVCPKVGTQFYVPTKVQAYLLDPSQQNNIDAALGDFDYAYASGLWSLAFSMVVGLYFVSHGIGQVLGMVRRG
ncbi:hypothetical protein Undi14_07930 [Undibacterium sp. 14-3-2]|uniref:hypothetical protein n=1 Tax=Undibacterium sp. 14-3-2 TaxID=2800129 RepID=UPI0019086DF1|nr:hypothetical protein [Undibacterium sp. 14-3-2]MBK1889964.1 hypothetical protein [Undibacterium sp. 14-3-2]